MSVNMNVRRTWRPIADVAEAIAEDRGGFDVTPRAELSEHRQCRVELDDRDLAIAAARRDLGQQLLRLRGLVRRARLPPELGRDTCRDDRVVIRRPTRRRRAPG